MPSIRLQYNSSGHDFQPGQIFEAFCFEAFTHLSKTLQEPANINDVGQ